MSEQPLASVIIPVYNGVNYLSEAIDSALNQTYTACEIVVVDDGSKDNTYQVIRSYGERVRGFTKPNGGVASALNHAIRQSRGEYVAWLSHDDLFLPEKISTQMDFFRSNPHLSACYSDYYVIDTKGVVIREEKTPWHPRARARRELLGNMYINGCTTLLRRSCFEEVGLFDETLRYTQDMEMWFRVLGRYEFGRVDQPLTRQRVHPEQGSVVESGPLIEELQVLFDRLMNQFDVAESFPEFNNITDKRRAEAMMRRWFGDALEHRRWHNAAAAQYRRAVALWPSWRNPARLNLLFGSRISPVVNVIRRKAAALRRRLLNPSHARE